MADYSFSSLDRKLIRELHTMTSEAQWDASEDPYLVCVGCHEQVDMHPCTTMLMLTYIEELEENLKTAQRTLYYSIPLGELLHARG